MKKLFNGFMVAVLLLSGLDSNAQLYISEILASNASINENPVNNDNSDWVEIYNAGTEPVDLINYYLTDDFDTPDKWQIPTNIVVEPGGYQLIWCDGSDLFGNASFKLSASGEELALLTPDLEIIDSLTFDVQLVDISYGIDEQNPGEYFYFSTATPGMKNNVDGIDVFEGFTILTPSYSVLGGFFEKPISVTITCSQGGIVRYTLDGSEPTNDSPEFDSPLDIDKTTIVRARVFEEGKIPGPIKTHSYFFGENFEERGLPVISIATNPGNFWDADSGIYVQDFKPEWEVPINIEFFENDGSDRASFNLPAGTKINGLNSWVLPQKMLGVYFEKKYGASKLEYKMFNDSDRNIFKSFALRVAGNDWSNTMLRDILGHELTKENSKLDIMNFRQCIVYVNGEYLGLHNLREKSNDDNIEGNHGIDDSGFDMIENEESVENGSMDSYASFMELYQKNLSIARNYNAVKDVMDIQNFTDFMIAELHSGNTSVNHNVMAWKPKEEGKWKWLLMDLDRGFFLNNKTDIDFFIDDTPSPFKALMENDDYVSYFGNRLVSQMLTSYSAEKVNAEIDVLYNSMQPEMPYQIDRWEGTRSSYGNAIASVDAWENEVCEVRAYVDQRPFFLITDLMNHGFDTPTSLEVVSYPENAGILKVNELENTTGNISGLCPDGMLINLEAVSKPGYEFIGWLKAEETVVLSRGSEWDYLDDGSEPDNDWFSEDYNATGWENGPAILGFGSNETTTINSTVGTGRRATNINSFYFRSSFEVESDIQNDYYINLLWDEGATVYINGKEVFRMNAGSKCEPLAYDETALATISDAVKGKYYTFKIPANIIKEGINTIAAEIHRGPREGGFMGIGGTPDDDLKFDLEIVTVDPENFDFVEEDNGYNSTGFVLEGNSIYFLQDGNIHLKAIYEQVTECIVPEIISEDLTLDIECSPYIVQENVTVEEGATLTIDPGVEIRMPSGGNFTIHGTMLAKGREGDTIRFSLNPDYKGEAWGALLFQNTSTTSILDYVTIDDASHGPIDRRDVAAISAFNASLEMSNIRIDNVFNKPIHARLSDIKLTDSYLHSRITGDLINVKYGKAYIENCDMVGNDMPDSDAIDYDDVENGVIRNVRIYDFLGFNSDAIDIGERAKNVLIDGIFVNNITDKGVSVGQLSSANVINSTFVNCNLGFGVKDSCRVTADHCVFYSCFQPIASYEKNTGSAGGNVTATNCIFSNSSDASYYVDKKSTLVIHNSISDNDTLPENGTNLFGNPYFVAPTLYNFNLSENSPCIGAASDKTDIGIATYHSDMVPAIVISGISVNSLNFDSIPEYIALYNPADVPQDITGYAIDKGITIELPAKIMEAGETIYLTDTLIDEYWADFDDDVFVWEKGKLSNNGETIQLVAANGVIIDHLKYDEDKGWPLAAFDYGVALKLTDAILDNHFPENWETLPFEDTDNDNVPDNVDECPTDPNKSLAGYCGCFNDEGSCVRGVIDLKEGWNLISFNALPELDVSVKNVLEDIATNLEIIKNDNGFYKPQQKNFLNSLEEITYESGYFIRVSSDVSFTLSGIEASGITIELNQGWNLMGAPIFEVTDIESIINKSDCTVTTIKDLDKWYSSNLPNGTLVDFEPGKGYYIYVEDNCIISWD